MINIYLYKKNIVKNKLNIFEEINKMKSLISVKSGTLISEQNEQIIQDAYALNAEFQKFNSDEQKILNILKKYNTKARFNNFYNYYQKTFGEILGRQLRVTFQATEDEIKQLKDVFKEIGIELKFKNTNNSYEFIGLTDRASDQDIAKVEEMWKDPKVSCVPAQPNARKGILSDGTSAYVIGSTTYYAGNRKQLQDGSMANYNCSTEFKTKQNVSTNPPSSPSTNQPKQNVNNRFQQTAASLGVQNAQMDAQTLQTILNNL